MSPAAIHAAHDIGPADHQDAHHGHLYDGRSVPSARLPGWDERCRELQVSPHLLTHGLQGLPA
jgi:hypothetical protein